MQKGMFLSSAFLIIASTIQKLEKGMILDPEELVSVSDFYADVERLKVYVR